MGVGLYFVGGDWVEKLVGNPDGKLLASITTTTGLGFVPSLELGLGNH
jgi:hypothetical protein